MHELLQHVQTFAIVGQIVGRTGSEVTRGVEQLHDNNSALQKDLKKARAEMFSGGKSIGTEEVIGKLTYIGHDFGPTDKETIAAWIDSQRARTEPVIA